MYPCPICGNSSFVEPPGSFSICRVCGWEDDYVQLTYPDLLGVNGKWSYNMAKERWSKGVTLFERYPNPKLKE